MGQYFLFVNLDKKEYIHPHKMNDGLKLGEHANCIVALYLLTQTGEPPFQPGRWAGDRIVCQGAYADLAHKFYCTGDITNHFTEISNHIKPLVAQYNKWAGNDV